MSCTSAWTCLHKMRLSDAAFLIPHQHHHHFEVLFYRLALMEQSRWGRVFQWSPKEWSFRSMWSRIDVSTVHYWLMWPYQHQWFTTANLNSQN